MLINNYYFCCGLILVNAVHIVSQDPVVTMHITQNNAYLGDEITITCRVKNRLKRTVSIGKQVIKNEGMEVIRQEISADTFLLPRYSDTKRFDLRWAGPVNDVDLIILHISDAQYEDTAWYWCMVLGTESFANVELQIFRQPSDLQFVNVTYENTVLLKEGSTNTIRCMTSNVMPIPQMSVKMDGTDLTHIFQKRSHVTNHCTNDNDAKCLLHFTYTVELVTDQFLAVLSDDGKKLTCTAQLTSHLLKAVVTETHIGVKYSPRFNCSHYYMVAMYADHVKITCYIRFNPQLEDDLVLTGMKGQLIIVPNMGKQGVHFSKKVVSKTRYMIEIKIPRVYRKHFGVYTVIAINELGAKMHNITLLEDTSHHHSSDMAELIISQTIPNSCSKSKLYEVTTCMIVIIWTIFFLS